VKSISASVIVLAAAILIASGGHLRDRDHSFLMVFIGILLFIGGFITWWVMMTKEK
jgi:hypothetical protein